MGMPAWPQQTTMAAGGSPPVAARAGGDDNLGDKDRDPVPVWNGGNPMVSLKPYLRQLEIWRHDTSVPTRKHGTKLYKALGLPEKTCLFRNRRE